METPGFFFRTITRISRLPGHSAKRRTGCPYWPLHWSGTPDLRCRVSNPGVIIPWDTIRTECVDRGHLVRVERDGTGYRISLTHYSDELSRRAGHVHIGQFVQAAQAGRAVRARFTPSGPPSTVRKVWWACCRGYMEKRRKTPRAGRSGAQSIRCPRTSFKRCSWTFACRAGLLQGSHSNAHRRSSRLVVAAYLSNCSTSGVRPLRTA